MRAMLWEPLSGGTGGEVRCRLCAHACRLKKGGKGLCGVRVNLGGEMVSLVGDVVTSAQMDPVEKKPLYHFLPGSKTFSVGSAGCNFRCRFCQNYQIARIPANGMVPGKRVTPDALVRLAEKHGARSMAFTYNEPTVFFEQVYETVRQSGERVDSLVLMGIGEPLDNYDNVIRFLRLLTDPKGYNLGQRHISLSTCGLVDRIYDLAKEDLGITLSISLHAPDNETRNKTMPVNRRWSVEQLMQACRDYFRTTGRRISFEYALIKGVNDSPADAQKLAKLLDGMICHVNLIPVNPVKERGYDRTAQQDIRRFVDTLGRLGVNATVRRELGSDINAACGQLRRQYEQGEEAKA